MIDSQPGNNSSFDQIENQSVRVFENVLVGAMLGANQRQSAAYARAIDVLQTCSLVDVANSLFRSGAQEQGKLAREGGVLAVDAQHLASRRGAPD